MKYEIKEMTNSRYFVEFKEKNSKGERLVVEVTRCTYDNTSKDSLPNLWIKNGYTKHLYTTAIHIDTFCHLENGDCVNKYNPTIKLSNDRKRYVINFDNLLDVTPENEKKLIENIYDLFMRGEKNA